MLPKQKTQRRSSRGSLSFLGLCSRAANAANRWAQFSQVRDAESSSCSRDVPLSRGFDGSDGIKAGSDGSDAGVPQVCVASWGKLFTHSAAEGKPPAGDPRRGQPSSMHYAGGKSNNKRTGNDTWRPGFIKEDATGRRVFALRADADPV